MKLTREEYEKQQELKTIEGNAASYRRRQISVVKRAYDWQEKEGIYAWEPEDLQPDTGITLIPGPFILERDGIEVQFVREATPDGEPDVPENEGHFGNYTLTALGDNKFTIGRIVEGKPKE